MTKNLKLNDSAQCAVTSRLPHESGKILQLQRRIKTLESEKRQLQKELEEQQRQTFIERQEKEEEKRYKNQAYYFILSDGSFQKFAEFHKTHPANLDYHGACLAQFYLDSFTKNNM